ncbi:MAG: thiamine pyrophosphate-dependent dehydrogenase E1 component subunit alpha [Thermodesulfovibrionales bacterium]|nr:thiamine pyrophosphate-dependent dehydrogenase E1 component subunit alpha [Thermodesulfovibrionales bacterium]
MKKYTKGFLENLYRQIIRIRFCEESLVEPILKGEIKCPCHLYSGEEAIATGVCAALEERDYVFGNHRSHGHYLAKGGSMPELIAEIYGKETGCSKGRGGSMHVIVPDKGLLGAAPLVAGTISLAVGAALAAKIRKEDRVTVSFFGDGAAGEGVLYESLNFASLKKLPIIFACENNLYSTHMPIRECRPGNNIFKSSVPFCIPGYRVDGNDVLKVYELSKKAVELCRKGQGPVFIEFMTYRLRGHVGPDDNIQGTHTDIRPKTEIEKWTKRDPIKRFEKTLLKNRILTKEDLEIIRKETEAEVKNAYVFTMNSPYPEKNELTKYVFKE